MQNTSTLRDRKGALTGFGLTLALFLSGLFVLLTPLPLLFHLCRRKTRALWDVAIPAFVAIVGIYLFLLLPLFNFYKGHPSFVWVLPIPGINLLETVSPMAALTFGLFYFSFFMGLAWVLYKAVSDGFEPRWIFWGGLLFSFLASISFISYVLIHGGDPVALVHQYYQDSFQEFLTLQKQAGSLGSETESFLADNITVLAKGMTSLTPALVLISVFFVFLLNVMVAGKIFAPLLPAFAQLDLGRLTYSFYWVWGVILAIATVLGDSYLPLPVWLSAIASNLILVALFFYFVRGLSIMAFWMNRKGFGPFLKMVFYILIILLFHILGSFLVGLGFFDSWFDFRKLEPQSPLPKSAQK